MKTAALLVLLAAAAGCKSAAPRCENPDAPQPALTPILAEARKAAYDKDYDLALKKTGEVLRYRGDPDEAMAWAIRGSTFYLMGKSSKAKAAWKRAYAIDPCMKDIPGLIQKLEASTSKSR